MLKPNQKRYTFENLITFINVVIVFRLLILAIDIDFFRDGSTGKLSALGENIKFFQLIVEGVTNPIVVPFKNIILFFASNADVELVNILAPVFVIVGLVLLNLIVKLSQSYYDLYFNKKRDM